MTVLNQRACAHAAVRLLVSVSVAALSAGVAVAQTAPSSVDEVVVTGSRIIRNGDASPTPLTVIGSDQLQDSAPTSVADALAQIPEFVGNPRPSSALSPIAPTGAFLNLRGLGQSRTLVLLAGQRVSPTSIPGGVDVNTFPQLLVKRVDIVTGGASAAYGTDAVSGVVNYILDTKLEGLRTLSSYGVSDRGDDAEYRASVAGGSSFAGGKGHFVGSVDYTKSRGILDDSNRAWDNQGWDIIQNPTYPASGTAFLLRSGVRGAQLAEGGVIVSGPLKGTQFLAGGATGPFTYGSLLTTNTMIGGSGAFSKRGNIVNPNNQVNLYGHVSYDLSNDLNVFAELGGGESKTSYPGTAPNFSGSTAFTIFNDNAYLPTAIRNQMAAAAITSFQLGRLSDDWGRSTASNDLDYIRGALGLEYRFSGWTFTANLNSGATRFKTTSTGTVNQPLLFNAADAVVSPTTGQPVCRSTLTNPGNGCVPLNLFGPNSASAAALNYIRGTLYADADIKQTTASVNLSGALFSTWAGPVQTGVGIDYRTVSLSNTADPGSTAAIAAAPGSKGLPAALVGKLGVWFTGSQSPVPSVSEEVQEYYAEALVPLAKDMAFIHSLELNAGVRYASYSISGAATSWKVGLNYQPTEEVRIRITDSRDTRAPTLNELYGPVVSANVPTTDPLTRTSGNAVIYSGGNPNLRNEAANTTTLGVVYSPAWLPRFSFSIDYHDISVEHAIGTLSAAQVLTLCTSGNTAYCGFIVRLANNALVSVSTQALNLNRLNTKGEDYEANYSYDLEPLRLPGQISARALISHTENLTTTDPFGNVSNAAGDVGLQGIPKWQGSASLTYSLGSFSALFQERYIAGGAYSKAAFVTGGTATNSLDINKVPQVWYSDLTLRYKLPTRAGDYQLFATINNLFDRDPPVAPNRQGNPISIIATNATLYDIVGRYYTVGIRANF